MLDRILVPLDGSALAEGILPYAERLGRERRALVTLLHVVDPETLERRDPDHAPFIDQLIARAEVRARDYLRHLEEQLRPKIGNLTTRLLMGLASERIVDYADQEGYNLIAMSTHGRSGVGRWVFGSVADRVLHATTVPLLLIRPPTGDASEPGAPFRRVLLPLDGSELAEEAAPYAIKLARRLDLEIELVRVVQFQMGTGFGLYVEDPTAILEQVATEYLTRVREGLQKQGLRVKSALLWGYPGARIVDAANADPGTIVVISSHGRSGVGRRVLGSIADKVVRAVGIPVVVVRPAAARGEQLRRVPGG